MARVAGLVQAVGRDCCIDDLHAAALVEVRATRKE
jgi:hypothetical protein